MNAPGFLKRRWWERPYIDLWTIPHALMGLLAASAVVYWAIDQWFGLLLVLAAAVAWEAFERLTGISWIEPWTNRLTDVLAALVGYGLGLLLFLALPNGRTFIVVVTVAVILDAVLTAFGWLSYRLFVSSRPAPFKINVNRSDNL